MRAVQEVPFRDPSLDPLSPSASMMGGIAFSPPLSPNSSMLLSAAVNIPNQSPATKPPSNMVMSPPGTSTMMSLGGALGDAHHQHHHQQGLVAGGLQIDLGCLLPTTMPADSAGQSPALLSGTETSTATTTPTTMPASASGAGPAATAAAGGAARGSSSSPSATSAPVAIPKASAPSAQAPHQLQHHSPGPTAGASATTTPNQQAQAERIQKLKAELGEGEGVTALLERSKAGNGAVVAVSCAEDEGMLSDDEFSGRPMSPLTRIRYDTFSASLDFIEALCDASSSLVTLPQEERPRALRYALESINRDLEAASRRSVAVWFPMGVRNDRVLRLASKEAVLLNSREKVRDLHVHSSRNSSMFYVLAIVVLQQWGQRVPQ